MIPTSSKRTVNSCQRCRARKIRCGRERPRCQNCLRSNHLCRYVEASPAASHTTDERHEDLTRRVSRLEAVVAQLAGRPVNEVLQEPEPRPRARESPVAAIGMVDNEPRLGLGSYWKQLAAQHPDFTTLLDGREDRSTVAARPSPSYRPFNPFAPTDPEFRPHDYLPPLSDAERLYTIFCERVDPIVRLVHKPTFAKEIQDYYRQPNREEGIKQSTAAFEALLFAMCFSTLSSLSEEEHWGHSPPSQALQVKEGCLHVLRSAIEQSLVRSDFLERPNIHSITACCLFLFVLCDEADVPYHYCLSGLLLRVARSFSLHVDPEALAGRKPKPGGALGPLNPIEIEVRRRLWHLIVHLDFISSEARGVDPEPIPVQCWPITLSTALPNNVDDEEIKSLAQPANDPLHYTDMTMSLVRFHLSLCLRHLATLPHGTPGPLGEAQSQYELDRRVEHYIDETLDTVERQYLRHCQVCEPTQKVTLALGRLGEYKTRLIVYHRFLKGRESTGDDSRWGPNRKRAMEIAKDLITAYQDLLADPSIRRFHWHIRRHSQLHGMMHILNELSAVDTLKLPPDVHMLCQCAWETIADVSMMSDISQRQTEQDERLWGFLRNLRERVRHRLYTQGFIDGTPLPSAALDDEMNLTFGQMSGADLLESLFDGQGIYFAPSADMPDL